MRTLLLFPGLFLVLVVFLDAFQTIILPRRPRGRFRPTRVFYIATWKPWSAVARRIRDLKKRDQFYSTYGPLSLLVLLAVWATLLILGFALIYFALGTPFSDNMMSHFSGAHAFWTDLYVSGTTLTTLGLGDVLPIRPFARAIIIFEAGFGLGLVALVVGYLPVLYGAFSRREVSVALLDGRAGSPPTAAELLTRHGFDGGERALVDLLAEWERWSAELLESHVSYPLLCYYRSQHDNQSWLSALVAILDACALLIATVEGTRQAQLTFAMARHAVIDLGHIFHLEERTEALAAGNSDRLPPPEFRRLCTALLDTEIQLCGDEQAGLRLRQLRDMYEPHACALADYLGLAVPLWIAEPRDKDPWKKVSGLSYPSPRHVSDRSTAASLHEEAH